MYSFCAMYSLRMSFWSVPDIVFQSPPCFSATARYIAQMTAAGELMVIEVVTLARGILSKRTSISASELMATPHLLTSHWRSGLFSRVGWRVFFSQACSLTEGSRWAEEVSAGGMVCVDPLDCS